jgi:acyl-CoA synthetase (AMP-forming)/AMP-acid ligase II
MHLPITRLWSKWAVIGVPEETWGETVKAVVARRASHSVAAAEIIASGKAHLAGYKCPTSVDYPAIPPAKC